MYIRMYFAIYCAFKIRLIDYILDAKLCVRNKSKKDECKQNYILKAK